jgi:hypothetical protein
MPSGARQCREKRQANLHVAHKKTDMVEHIGAMTI